MAAMSRVVTKTQQGCCYLWSVDSEQYDSMPGPEILPAEEHHVITQTWSKGNVGEKIVTLLDEKGIKFDAIDCVRRPRLLSYCENSVFGEDKDDYDSHTVMITLAELPDIHSNLDKAMLQIHHKITDQTTVEVRVGKVDIFVYQPYLGSSVGLTADYSTTGTIGCFVSLVNQKYEVIAECALTCEHIVRPYVRIGEGEMARPAAGSSDSYIVKTQMPHKHLIYCCSPSFRVHDKNFIALRGEYIRLSGEILANKLPKFDFSPLPLGKPKSPSEEMRLLKPSSEETKLLKLRRSAVRRKTENLLSNAFNTIGTLFASSGYNFTRHDHRLDWALIQMSLDSLPATWRNRTPNLGSNELTEVRQVLCAVKPQKNATVFKHGSASGVTIGTVNPVQSYVATYDAFGKRSVTAEWCVVPSGIGSSANHFAIEGDSGALVLEYHTANAMGMIFGGHSNGRPVYFTSITAIAANVEKLTGLKMQFPGGSVIGEW